MTATLGALLLGVEQIAELLSPKIKGVKKGKDASPTDNHITTPQRGAFCNRPCVFCIHKKVPWGLTKSLVSPAGPSQNLGASFGGPAELTNNLVYFAGTFLWIKKTRGPTKEAHAGEWL